MNPADIILLVQMVIQFLLQLFGKQPASVKAYIDGSDTSTLFRPFVMTYRKMQLKSFVKSYAVLHGIDANQAYDAVLAELNKASVEQINKVASQMPVK